MSAIENIKKAIIDEDANSVEFDTQMSRDQYQKVNEVLERFNGKWNSKSKKHFFPINPKPLIDAYLKTGIMPEKNPTAFFPTPKALSSEVVRLSELDDRASYSDEESQRKIKVLEPSGGVGGLADEIRSAAPFVDLDVVEILDINQAILREKGYEPICMDFMQYNTSYDVKYDYILMNPPFSLSGDTKAYITHVEHAFNMLDNIGTLVAIIPPGFINNSTKKEKDFLDLVAICGDIHKNPSGSFKESGTNIDTYTVVLDKSRLSWRMKEYQGSENYYSWYAVLLLLNERKYHDKFYKTVESDSFLKDVDTSLENMLLELIEDKKKEGDLIPLSLMDSYVKELRKLAIEHREDLGLDEIDEIVEEKEADESSSSANNVLYEAEQYDAFSQGQLF